MLCGKEDCNADEMASDLLKGVGMPSEELKKLLDKVLGRSMEMSLLDLSVRYNPNDGIGAKLEVEPDIELDDNDLKIIEVKVREISDIVKNAVDRREKKHQEEKAKKKEEEKCNDVDGIKVTIVKKR
jgi:hypothetical protein